MEEILVSSIPALLAFLGAMIKSKSDLKKQELQNDAKIAEIKAEAAEKREEDRNRFEDRLKEIKAETDEELRKADAALERKFLDNFTNPDNLFEQMEGLSKGIEAIPKLQEKMESVKKQQQKKQSQRGWR